MNLFMKLVEPYKLVMISAGRYQSSISCIHSGDSVIYRYTHGIVIVVKVQVSRVDNGQSVSKEIRAREVPACIPMEGFTRNQTILLSLYITCELTAKQLYNLYHASYSPERFVLSLIGVIPLCQIYSQHNQTSVSITLNVISSFSDIIYTFI